VRKRIKLGGLLAIVGALALAAAGCGGGGEEGGGGGGGGEAQALPAASCTALKYGGTGKPEFVIASDLPLQGAGRAQTLQMTKAIEFIFEQNNWKAGEHTIGYQSCDDSTAQAGGWESAKCSSNARAYANNKTLIGVIGTFNSGCAKLEIPVLNRATDGPVAMVSPANTYPGLTQGGPGTVSGEPDNYYPTGKRNYSRVVWTDAFQAAADAQFAKKLGLKNIFVLNDKQTYGLGVANLFKRSAGKLGIKIAGSQAWDAKATSYESIASKIKSSGADGVFLGGIVCNNGGKLVKDLRQGIGPDVKILTPDGFTPFSAVHQGAGQNAVGVYVSHPGIPVEKLSGAGKKFATDFGAQIGGEVDPYSSYAAQAAQVLIEAIKTSDGTRPSVAENLFKTKVTNGILGDFKLDKNGDTTLGTVTISQLTSGGGSKVLTTITPEISFVKG
jgi:branched-chain amino acid transport system substrate-binding protein